MVCVCEDIRANSSGGSSSNDSESDEKMECPGCCGELYWDNDPTYQRLEEVAGWTPRKETTKFVVEIQAKIEKIASYFSSLDVLEENGVCRVYP